MDCLKTGSIIKKQRLKNGMTQKQLADKLCLSDKTVSKWERGIGFPDLSVISRLADVLCVNVETILNGELADNSFVGGNMKNSQFFVCPVCGNISVCTGDSAVSCCGKKLNKIPPKKADSEHDLLAEQIEDEWYITSAHTMTKEHYISFVAFVSGERIEIIKQYPEWNLGCRFKMRGHGKLLFYCTKHGLFYKNI